MRTADSVFPGLDIRIYVAASSPAQGATARLSWAINPKDHAPISTVRGSKPSIGTSIRSCGFVSRSCTPGSTGPCGFAALDQELQEVVRDAKTGKRRVDKLYRVLLLDGTEEWILVHVEVQGRPDRRLPERPYRYHGRIADCYGRRVVTLAVLADTSPGFRPGAYEEETLGCRVRFEYPACKLLDFPDAQLERENNPVAIVIAAHRAAQSKCRDPVLRKAMKWQITRRLYERGYSKEDVLELFRLIDWLLHLPEEQKIEFRRELIEYEASKHMPYITSIEEMGRQEGRLEGRREGLAEGFRKGLRTGAITARQKAVLDALEIRFGPAPGLIRRSIESVQDEARLRSLHRIAIQAASLEAFARELEG